MSPFARSGPVTLQISTLGAALVGDVLRSRVACRPVSARPNSVAERIDRGCTLGRALSLGGAEGVPAAFPDGDEIGVAASAAERRQRRLRRHDLSQISSEQWSERFRIPLLEFGGSSVFVALPPDRSDSGRSRGAPNTEHRNWPEGPESGDWMPNLLIDRHIERTTRQRTRPIVQRARALAPASARSDVQIWLPRVCNWRHFGYAWENAERSELLCSIRVLSHRCGAVLMGGCLR